MELKKSKTINIYYLKHIYREFFNTSFNNLVEPKRILFKNENEYKELKFVFRTNMSNISRVCFVYTLSAFCLCYYVMKSLYPYFSHRRHLFNALKLPLVGVIGLSVYGLTLNASIELNSFIKHDCKFKLYLTLENAFYNGELEPVLSMLDDQYNIKLNRFMKSEVKDGDKLDLILFYNELKRHYLYLMATHNCLLYINGVKYFEIFKKSKLNSEEINSSLSSRIRRQVNSEFQKLTNIENDKLKNQIIRPNLKDNNIEEYFNQSDILYLLSQDLYINILNNEMNKLLI